MEPAASPRIVPRCRTPADAQRVARLRLAGTGPPVAIAPARCNRCGACLRLGCPAISDEGGEALVVDAGACSGCGACAPLCRARAIAAVATTR